MRCWNCGKEIPEAAKICQFCEAAAEPEPTAEEMEAVGEILDGMSPEVLGALRNEILRSETAEEFIDRIMVGECPRCGSEETSHCENDPEIDNLLVGRCYKCGQLWCTECRRLLEKASPTCACWEEDE